MSRLLVPAILGIVIVSALAFSVFPVFSAGAFHLSVQDTQVQIQQAEDLTDRTATGDGQTSTVTIGTTNDTPFILQGVVACGTSDGDGNGDGKIELTIGLDSIDGNTITKHTGDAINPVHIISDGVLSQSNCVEVLGPSSLGYNNGWIGPIIASDGGNIVFSVAFGDAGDKLDSIKVTAIVDGSSTLTVTSGVPA